MKVPVSWLREYVDFDDDVSGLAERLTFSGIEVEGIERVRDGLEDVVIGEILEVSSHPDADRLKLCLVSDGKQSVRVVCGADNMKAGDKAAFAPAGSRLPSGMKIKKAKVRGQESHGMLCAEDELGLSDDHSGIYLVDAAIATGSRINDVIGEPDDVLDLEITWNRPDCLSIIGIAREVAALYGTQLRLPEVDLSEGPDACQDLVSVQVTDFAACPRYTGRYLDGVELAPSPGWLQSRLAACGIRPINNVVDITNYVMLETGHPLHAFDYTLVEKGGIVVRFAKSGEKIVTLDGEERKLSSDILLITDCNKPLAVAGVMGGEGSQISEGTTRVLLESATFHPPVVHRAVSQLGLMSESSHRFERNVDFDWVDFASRRAAGLICEIGGGRAARGVVDAFSAAPAKRVVGMSMRSLNGVMGIEVASEEAMSILESLQFDVEESDNILSVTVPGFRSDIEIEADLIEEIARMKGLDAIPAAPPSCHAVGSVDDTLSWRREEIRNQLVSLGLTETVNYSFMSERLAALMDAAPGVKLPNPVSSDYCVMRGAIAPQMVDLLGRNLAHQNRDCACFEIGKTFAGKGAGISETERICIGVMGHVGRYSLDRVSKPGTEEVFLWVKGILESLCAADGKVVALKPLEMSLLEPSASAGISVDGKVCGWIGGLAAAVRSEYRMQDAVVLAEIDLAALTESSESDARIAPIPAFPAVSRDIAVVVPESVLHCDILEVIEGVKCPELTHVELFDIFRGRGTGEGKKSMAYSFRFQSSERTLTDDEANGFRDRIRDGLVSKLNAEIREG